MRELLSAPKNAKEGDVFNKYLKQIKEECGARLIQTLYMQEWGTMDLKYWLTLGKKPFLGRKFNNALY